MCMRVTLNTYGILKATTLPIKTSYAPIKLSIPKKSNFGLIYRLDEKYNDWLIVRLD